MIKKSMKYMMLTFILFIFCKYYLGLFAEYIQIEGERGVVWRYSDEEDGLLIDQKIIIVNPPANSYILEYTIKNYDEKIPLSKEIIQAAIKKRKEMQIKAGKKAVELEFRRMFFKQSWHTPKDWDGKDDPEREGRISWHGNDLIAIIRWAQGDADKKYEEVDID